MSEIHKSGLRVALGSLRVKHGACGWRLSDDGLALHGTYKGRAVTLAPGVAAYKATTDDGEVASSSALASRAMTNLFEHLNGARVPLFEDDLVVVESRGAPPVVDAWHDAMVNMALDTVRLALPLWRWQVGKEGLIGFVEVFGVKLRLDVSLMPGAWSVTLGVDTSCYGEVENAGLLLAIMAALDAYSVTEEVYHAALRVDVSRGDYSADTRAVATVEPLPNVVAIDDYTARGLAMADALRRLADKMQAGEVRALLVTGAVMEDGELCNWHLVDYATLDDAYSLTGRAACSQARLVEKVRAMLEGDQL